MQNEQKINRKNILKALRKELKLSQESFGAAIGVNKATIYRWESGISKAHLTLENLVKLTKLLKKHNQTLESLLEEIPESSDSTETDSF